MATRWSCGTNVKHLFINGHPVDLATRHTKLYEKFSNRP